MTKWKCDCGNVFLSKDYIPFKKLPICPKCGKRVCVTIPKCHKCGRDGSVWTGYIGTMHVYTKAMCPEHMKEFLEFVKNESSD